MWWLVAAGVSHFSMVGFPVDTTNAQTAGADFERFAQTCKLEQLDEKSTLCIVEDGSGAELWIGLRSTGNDGTEIITVNPAFSGKGTTKIAVTADASVPEWKPFERSVQAKFSAEEVPLILDLADPREASIFAPDAKLDVDITAFADELSLHDSEDAYFASQKNEEIKFAPNHFIPSGMFNTEAGAKDYPTANAVFAGKVLEAELRQNDVGKGRYWWILVETLDGARVNVVADPTMLKNTPKTGGILSGSFWLSARIAKPRQQ